MAGRGGKFSWDFDNISPKLNGSETRARQYISRTTTYHALRSEGFAKIMASWTDRTGNARSGLKGEADNSKSGRDHWEIVVSHSMNYGIWLEVRFGGRYAIILPTIRHEAPEYWKTALQVYKQMFEGAGSV